ncbi:short-chain dehydrogenase [Actinosynnema sp. ALI-1.44]|uniref:SDR family NAD(P)-dependent oxidoreductase n=1 Tax=Actinosynnema sp. ALI-1.44 TaxID=1933779 RepID=UPI00097C220B|nr:SDR family oxidoreductase [Actinosynnema sp. ALI-1.44]ONI79314.1 short-chain dehydrogenase [Actinosynnema sp. ALI-1.44]
MGTLAGKAVVVTGAGRGLGEAYAVHAAAAGAAVVVNDVLGELAEAVAERIRAAGGRAVANGHSVADPVRAAELVEQCVDEFGKVDGLVNNAGIRHDAKPWDDSPERIREVIEVNVLGSMYCGTAAARAMHGQGSGAILNIASLALVGQGGAAAYSASKAAVASMTVSWAVDFARQGVRVNALCPLAYTPMAAADPRATTGPRDSPDRIAPLVTYLLSDRSAHVTGQVIRFTGTQLHLYRQFSRKPPTPEREQWDVADFAAAFDGEFDMEEFPSKRFS